MPLASMTGFARASGALGSTRWTWEIRSVNSKGLDVRLRTPPQCDEVEQAARVAVQARLKRGSIQATLTIERPQGEVEARLNEGALAAVLAAAAAVAERLPNAAPPTVDGILSQRGVVEIVEREETGDERAAVMGAAIADFAGAIEDLVVARAREGAALETILKERLSAIEDLTARADACPGRSPEAVRKRLAEQMEALFGTGAALDPDRLHQEAMLLATRADVREELDRLVSHVEAARALIAEGGAVGRRLDFLAQEFGRESNTLCAKSNDRALTAIGLELKAVVEQFREQVQNVE